MTVDPVVDLVARLALATLFVWAASHKARDLRAFAATIRSYEILPRGLARLVAPVFAGAELAVAVGLVLPETRVASSAAALVLLVTYSVAIAVNLARGRRELDCGCFGPAHRQPLHGWLLVRNAVAIAAAALASLPLGLRPLTTLDGVAIVAGWSTACLLWLAASQLATQWQRIEALRRPS